jgi:hypothetical protein
LPSLGVRFLGLPFGNFAVHMAKSESLADMAYICNDIENVALLIGLAPDQVDMSATHSRQAMKVATSSSQLTRLENLWKTAIGSKVLMAAKSVKDRKDGVEIAVHKMLKASGVLQDDTMLGMVMQFAEVGADAEASEALRFVRLLNPGRILDSSAVQTMNESISLAREALQRFTSKAQIESQESVVHGWAQHLQKVAWMVRHGLLVACWAKVSRPMAKLSANMGEESGDTLVASRPALRELEVAVIEFNALVEATAWSGTITAISNLAKAKGNFLSEATNQCIESAKQELSQAKDFIKTMASSFEALIAFRQVEYPIELSLCVQDTELEYAPYPALIIIPSPFMALKAKPITHLLGELGRSVVSIRGPLICVIGMLAFECRGRLFMRPMCFVCPQVPE